MTSYRLGLVPALGKHAATPHLRASSKGFPPRFIKSAPRSGLSQLENTVGYLVGGCPILITYSHD